MKTLNLRRVTGLFTLLAFFSAGFSSCSKDDTSALTLAGSVNVMIVNGAEGSAPQDYYLDNTKINSSAVAYASNSSYISTAAGNHQGQFRATGTTTVTASSNVTFESGKYYTVYLSGSSTSSSTFSSEDDMSAPASGKAKVRFVHLSSAVTSAVDFGVTGGNKIVTSLAYQAASAYQTVDANSGFTLYLAGSSTASLAIPAAVQAGKIYTIYVSGSTTATLSYHLIVQN